MAPDGVRKTVRLGKITKKSAESFKGWLERLLAAKLTNGSIDGETATWLAKLSSVMYDRLVAVGLAEPRESLVIPTLGEWFSDYSARRTNWKPNTRRNALQASKAAEEYFGKRTRLDRITVSDAEDFFRDLQTTLSANTARRRCKRVRQFFNAAIKKRLITENPFDTKAIPTTSVANDDREYFLTREDAQAVIDACPDAEWRLIFALCRYGGLRCPSEVLRLKWEDIHWDTDWFTVHSAKTEHHDNQGIRQVPIFHELRPYLDEAFALAEPGAEYCITRYRSPNCNLRTQLHRIIKRAGLTPWPKTFQNLRATRQTELTEEHPLHVVTKWLGNSPTIARKHYLQATPEHHQKAVQKAAHNPAQYVHAGSCKEAQVAPAGRDGREMQVADKKIFAINCSKKAAPCETAENRWDTPTGSRTPVSRMRT